MVACTFLAGAVFSPGGNALVVIFGALATAKSAIYCFEIAIWNEVRDLWFGLGLGAKARAQNLDQPQGDANVEGHDQWR